jgi:hypothetical protein
MHFHGCAFLNTPTTALLTGSNTPLENAGAKYIDTPILTGNNA